MLNKFRFILGHQAVEPRFYSTYQQLLENQWKPFEELRRVQTVQFRSIIRFAYDHVPYYHNLFRGLGLSPSDFHDIEDLKKIPVLSRKEIKNHGDAFIPDTLSSMKYYRRSTGGSTGNPLHYRLSKFDRFLNGALLYRGWGYAGYSPGDRMIFLGGASLDTNKKPFVQRKVHEITRNTIKLSTFDMGEREMHEYVRAINTFKPKFIRGYASPVFLFSHWIEKMGLEIHTPTAVFTTAEILTPQMRNKISGVFNCDVYDNYGLNDGGVSAFECPEHNGLHIDTERSIMEIVDEEGNPMEEGTGRIIATSLHNYAMPFLRYETGDIATLSAELCPCGREYRLLKQILGRTVDMLFTPDGKNIYGGFVDMLLQEYGEGILEYQVIQKKPDRIMINIVTEDGFDEKNLQIIRDLIHRKENKWVLEFRYVDKIQRTRRNKYRVIINELLEE